MSAPASIGCTYRVVRTKSATSSTGPIVPPSVCAMPASRITVNAVCTATAKPNCPTAPWVRSLRSAAALGDERVVE